MYKVQNLTRAPILVRLSAKDLAASKAKIPQIYSWGVKGDVREGDNSDASVVEIDKAAMEALKKNPIFEALLERQDLIVFQGSIALAA